MFQGYVELSYCLLFCTNFTLCITDYRLVTDEYHLAISSS